MVDYIGKMQPKNITKPKTRVGQDLHACPLTIWGLVTEFFSERTEIWVTVENPYNEQASCGESDHFSYRLGRLRM